MQTTQIGDRVHVHFVKQYSDGSVRSSRARGEEPLELTVGTAHPRLPGLASELVGLTEGQSVTLHIPAERAYGVTDPARVRRVSRSRFQDMRKLIPGQLVRMQLKPERLRLVKIVKAHRRTVVVDLNHPRCGQALVIKVEIVNIARPEMENGHWGP